MQQVGNKNEESSTKFLGVLLDENLTWKMHLKHINTKISRAMFSIKQVKNMLPLDSLRTLYFSMIHPHLSYGILAWGNATTSNLKHTITLQKRAIRLINRSAYNSHTDPLFKNSQILKLNDLYTYETTMFMYKYMTNKLPPSFANIFIQNHLRQEHHNTRQVNLLHIEKDGTHHLLASSHYIPFL